MLKDFGGVLTTLVGLGEGPIVLRGKAFALPEVDLAGVDRDADVVVIRKVTRKSDLVDSSTHELLTRAVNTDGAIEPLSEPPKPQRRILGVGDVIGIRIELL